MLRGLLVQGLLTLFVVVAPLSVWSQTDLPAATGHVVIKFREAANSALQGPTHQDQLASLLARLPLPPGCFLRESKLSALNRRTGRLPQDAPPELSRFFRLQLAPRLSVEETLRRLENHPWVEYVEADGRGSGGGFPDDPDFVHQWHHANSTKPGADIETPRAWDTTTGANDIIVAVLDSGLNASVSEFAGRVVAGYDFANDDNDPADDHGHGTAVAGTLCAAGNNQTLVAGVDWKCRIMPIKILDNNNVGSYVDWAEGIDFAVSRGCKVINLSAGGLGSSTPLTTAIQNAVSRGVIFVTITHNQASSVRYPGNLPESITVGATDEQDDLAGFSNFGPEIDLVAPGTNIWTVSRSGTAQRWWGTSFAAPLVSGVCSLMASENPEITQEEARALLTLGAEDMVGANFETPGFDNYYGWGRLNAYHSLLLNRAHLRIEPETSGEQILSWESPANAADKQPFQVERKHWLQEAWTAITGTDRFHYTPDTTFWTNTTTEANSSYFRLRLRTP